MENRNFGDAIGELKAGRKVWRNGWNGKDMYLYLIKGDNWGFGTDTRGEEDIETQPFICMKTANHTLVPWLASQTDMLAEDWCSDRVY